jgi:hypothetical protein
LIMSSPWANPPEARTLIFYFPRETSPRKFPLLAGSIPGQVKIPVPLSPAQARFNFSCFSSSGPGSHTSFKLSRS